MISPIAALLVLVAFVEGHSTLQEVFVNDVSAGLYNCVRKPVNNYPVHLSDANFSCKASTPSTTVCPAKAGDTIHLQWHHEPDGGQAEDSEDPVASPYLGPYQVYLAKVTDAATSSSADASWFKIMEDGYRADNTWGLGTFHALKGKALFTLPCDLADGDYLVCGEFMSFHNGPAQNQLYMGCAELRVTGEYGEVPGCVSEFGSGD
ncbi:hypothetical protein L873DRAFT_1808969 [Choiromyces venosus 120613-1]|uniref:AA9 family lytic polysaccharide monooxygenase n=1 Tax=Choiromyces venosus 120613-1 TaxID=1336337 RepID=A0A3N4JHY0_9PEZI|nr:hypothetical protein L873DRAFT_1808969 [Choiromyces venosus 120613-1]